MKGGDNLDSWKRGNLRKGGYDPPYKLWLYYGLLWLSYDVTKVGVRLMQMRVLSAFFLVCGIFNQVGDFNKQK